MERLDELYPEALGVVIEALRADRAAVLLLDRDQVMRFEASRGLSDRYRRAVEGHSPWALDDPEPGVVLVSDVESDAAWEPHRELFREEGLRALGFVPLVHARRLLGKFMIYCDEPRTFTQREIELARTIATQISQAVARARLLEAERSARAAAERSAEQVLRLQRVTASLSKAATPAEVAQVVVAQGLATTGAALGGLWLVDASSTTAELVESHGYSEEGRRAFTQIDLNGPLAMPVIDAIRSAEPIWLESNVALSARYPQLARAVSRPEHRIACLPITANGKVLGALAFSFDVAGHFDDGERGFLLSVARQGGLALERSRLLHLEQAARLEAEAANRRAAFKAEASAALASSLDYEAMLRSVAKLAVPKFADWCAIELGEFPGRSTLMAVEHADPAKVELARRLRERFPGSANAPRGVAHVLRTGKAELYDVITDELLQQSCRDAEHLALARSLELRSVIIAPIAIQGRIMGAITFVWAQTERHYDAADLEMAVLLGQRAALAIDNSKLHRNLQRAVKARDDLLAVVSHDLRNPLGVVSMKAEAITRSVPADPSWEKVRRHADGIRSAAGRMEQLIDDLLDVGSIEAGQLRVEPLSHELSSLVATVVEEMQPLAASRGLRLAADTPARPLRVRCDDRRIHQVFSNLVGNAIKFTPSGGSILIRPASEGNMVRVTVSDTGRGIAPDHLAQIFERYYQAPTRERSGVGLGLFIAKAIIEAHGGRIWAESAGTGSRFHFTLPLEGAP